jgi:SAM-dependent methyltransferase
LSGPDTRLLDVGCAGGHLRLSLARRGLECDYRGLDYSPSMVKLAKAALRTQGLDPDRIFLLDAANLRDKPFDVVVMINVLSFNPDFRIILERLAETGARAMIIRDNFGARTEVRWELDGHLDPGFESLKGYWNTWSRREVSEFLEERGYTCSFVRDERTRGRVEMVVGKPYRWSWLVASKLAASKVDPS